MAVTFVPLREMKTSKGQVISDKDLEILLDRSDLLGEERHHSVQGALEYITARQHRPDYLPVTLHNLYQRVKSE